MVTIVGASGAVGIPLIKELVKRGVKTKVFTSNRSSEIRLKKLGVAETILGDYRVGSDVDTAIKGSKHLCYIPPRFKQDEFEIGKRIIDSAIAARVEHLCFCSAIHPQIETLGHHWQKLQIEQYLIGAELKHTVIQPSMFMQNISVEWPRIINEGVYSRPYSPDSQMNVIDTDDLGEAITNIITNKTLWGATYELCGSRTLSHNEMAMIITEKLGKDVTAVHRDIEEWKQWALERNWTAYAIEHYIRMCLHYNEHGLTHGNDITLQALIGRPATDYPTFIEKFIESSTSK